VVVIVDVVLSVLAVWCAMYLRLDQVGMPVAQQGLVYPLAPMLAVRPIFICTAHFSGTGLAALATTAVVGLANCIFF
jgi:hypothetical protein